MKFVAFLEDLGNGICWMLVICWNGLDGHVIVMVKCSVRRDFFNSFFLKANNQAFLNHIKTLLNII